MHFGKFILKYITKLKKVAVDALKNSGRWSKIKIWAKAVRIFYFYAHNIHKSLRHIMVPYNICDFVKRITKLIKERGLRAIKSTEPNNEMKYQEEIDNPYNKLLHCKNYIFLMYQRKHQEKLFTNELTKILIK